MNRMFVVTLVGILTFFNSLFSQTDSLNVHWDPNPEQDVVFYYLFRAKDNFTDFSLLDSIVHPQTNFVDKNNIRPGSSYAYTLAAVDSSGNMSEYSDTVLVGIPSIKWCLEQVIPGEEIQISPDSIFYDPDNSVSELKVLIRDEKNIHVSVKDGKLCLLPTLQEFADKASFRLVVTDPNKLFDEKEIHLKIQQVTGLKTMNETRPAFTVSQNYPNPFNPDTEIRYTLPENCQVRITVFDLLGRKIKDLVNRNQGSGLHRTTWDGADELGRSIGSGKYFFVVQTQKYRVVKEMILLR